MREVTVAEKKRILVEKLFYALSFTLFLAFLSQIKIPLPFTPVPLTLQTLGVLLIGYYLGARLGLFTILLYLTLGVLGLPFFSGLKGGLPALAGPTGGYLVGFAFAVYLTGKAKEWGYLESWLMAVLVGIVAHLVIYILGVLWFYSGFMKFSPLNSFSELLKFTVYPFVPVDLIKSVLFASAIAIYKRVRG